ncbi:tRNA (adenosine(37)-N6)-dimethylallyltransferase MiaA [Alicyclobacillus mali]|uniref:tRNA dimethylallyltransferase n=1 Tax=Alicyclobacillus mali (ex Roth et al. 2021) TaxID=1123961 RepID=A0ABS0F1L7_9BACL|nr:tRNA (adenosine(37)-N6)-dimethylallyltransferase MiaA [Alicyclobacillus mali (ex Roth et al. 2021)]MBF8377146.1 tRNA (adenosine(37)-N6)-dimethylallyltransferase MiaA [Alicyclobacillus mali (ex Roth et al. 2021)]MCL6488011.1 tRNA (adenosine(37)-N6)-dimethylallyltransferase MiaA [Alicyclobacillus mali (ex Roth et al. 2021)]
MTDRKPIVCVVGPTGVGKSELSVEIARRYGGEVVSADSMQIYRGMDIGTAKLRPDEMRGVPHHLLDIADPAEKFTVAQWKLQADAVIDDALARGRLPVVCGGTGLYVRALLDDLDFSQTPEDVHLRAALDRRADEEGVQALYEELRAKDPERARMIHPNDRKRIVRALEVAMVRGTGMSEDYDWTPRHGQYEALVIGITMPREALYQRIDRRVEMMWRLGLVDEVKRLLAAGVPMDGTAMQAIGYKEIVAYLSGAVSEEEAIRIIQQSTRRFAKRQWSWFKRDPRVHWFTKGSDGRFSTDEIARLWASIDHFLQDIGWSTANRSSTCRLESES